MIMRYINYIYIYITFTLHIALPLCGGPYYAIVMSVRPSVRPSVCLSVRPGRVNKSRTEIVETLHFGIKTVPLAWTTATDTTAAVTTPYMGQNPMGCAVLHLRVGYCCHGLFFPAIGYAVVTTTIRLRFDGHSTAYQLRS